MFLLVMQYCFLEPDFLVNDGTRRQPREQSLVLRRVLSGL